MAVDQMILRTTTDAAPWHIIPANNKWYARVATLKAINKGLAGTIDNHKAKKKGRKKKKK